MPADPFRSLDRIDPPDQWGAIVERASRDAEDDLPVVDLGRRPGRTRALVAAAAVVALVGGSVALATSSDEGADDVAAGPATEQVGGGGPCPFAVEADVSMLTLAPGPHPRSVVDAARATVWHGTYDDREVEVAVGPGIQGPTGALDAPEWELVSAGDVWLVARAALVAASDSGAPPACATAAVAFDVTDLYDSGTSSVPALAAAVEDGVDAILGALRDALHPEAATPPCAFTLDGDPSLPPLTPKAPDAEAPFTLLHGITDQWQSTEVDGVLVIVAVGGRGTGPLTEPVGTRWVGAEASFDTGAARAELRGNQSLAATGPCTDAVAHAVVPLTDDEVAAIEEGRIAGPGPARAQAAVRRVLDAVAVPGEDEDPTTPQDPVPPADPLPTPDGGDDDVEAALPDGRRWVGVVTPEEVCVAVEGDSGRSCSGRAAGPAVAIAIIDSGTPDETLILHGPRPEGAVETYLRTPDGQRVDAPVWIPPNDIWWFAYWPDPFTAIDMSAGWPVVHLDGAGAEIPVL